MFYLMQKIYHEHFMCTDKLDSLVLLQTRYERAILQFFLYYIYLQRGLLIGAPGLFLSGGSMEYDSNFSKPLIATPRESYLSIPLSGSLGEQYFDSQILMAFFFINE
jgi:hypothetical protein